MKLPFDTAVIIGVGLLGGSLGLALKERRLARYVRGVGRRATSLDTARAMGAIDESYLDPVEACRNAELVVLCTAANTIPALLDAIRPACGPDAVVTDVASTKGAICAHAAATWPSPLRFIGSHPMAGSEKFGPEHAYASLYEGSVAIIEPEAGHAPDAHAAVCALWRAVGARIIELEPQRHDTLLARTSHIPHVTAACLALLAAEEGDVRAVVGGGFRDTTRIAAGRPEIWRDICLTNRKAILDGLDALRGRLDALRGLLESGDGPGLEAFLEAGCEARRKALDE